jgi:flagellar hook-associated protein 1 FlgK
VSAVEDGQGLARIQAGGVDVTALVSTGSLGGVLNVRDQMLPEYAARLDQVAFDVVRAVNTLHQSGFDAAGDPGVAFFQPIVLAGAASAMAMNPLLTAAGGATLVAASATSGVAGDTSVARGLAALRDQPITNGGSASATEAWGQLVYRVGRDRAASRAGENTQSEVLRQLQNLQDGVSGVSLDEEAADMLRFQRGYEANARFFTMVDQMLDTLIAMVR